MKSDLLITEEHIRVAAGAIDALSAKDMYSLGFVIRSIENGRELTNGDIKKLKLLGRNNVIFQQFVESHLAKMGEDRQSEKIMKAFIDNTPR